MKSTKSGLAYRAEEAWYKASRAWYHVRSDFEYLGAWLRCDMDATRASTG